MQRFARAAIPFAKTVSMVQPKFTTSATRYLATIRFAASHEYVSLEGDIATVGITAHAADALGDIVFVDLPSVGADFSAGDSFGAVESVKAASDVYSPVDGQVLEVNLGLEEAPGKVNDSPLKEGWFMKLKITKEGHAAFEGLMDETAYKAHVDAEEH